MKNINVDANPNLFNFFLTLYNNTGARTDQSLDYLTYCLRNSIEKDLITRLPIKLLQQTNTSERKSKFKDWSKYKLKFLGQMAISDLIELNRTNEDMQVTDFNILYSLR